MPQIIYKLIELLFSIKIYRSFEGLSLLIMSSKSQFWQNLIVITKANILARAIPLLATPIITRIYSPQDFAILAQLVVITSIISSFSTARFDWSVPNAKYRPMGLALIALSTIFLFLTVLISIVFISLGLEKIIFENETDQFLNFIFLIPIIILFQGVKSICEGWFIRENKLAAVSFAQVVESSSNVIMRLFFGFLGFGSIGLISSLIISNFASMFSLLLRLKKIFVEIIFISKKYIYVAFLRFRYEATWSSLNSIFNVMSTGVPILLMLQFYSEAKVGLYSVMISLAFGPVTIFSSALAQSFWGEAARLVRLKEINKVRKLYIKTTMYLVAFSFILLITCLSGPLFVGPLLGDIKWGEGGVLLQMMCPALIGTFIFSSTNHFIVYGKQIYQLIADSSVLVCIFLLFNFVETNNIDFKWTVLGISFIYLFGYFVKFLLHLLANKQFEKSLKNV